MISSVTTLLPRIILNEYLKRGHKYPNLTHKKKTTTRLEAKTKHNSDAEQTVNRNCPKNLNMEAQSFNSCSNLEGLEGKKLRQLTVNINHYVLVSKAAHHFFSLLSAEALQKTILQSSSFTCTIKLISHNTDLTNGFDCLFL